jgi:hypothetical protein
MDFSLAAEILAEMLTYIVDDAKKHAPNRHFASGQDGGGCAVGLPRAEARLACRKGELEMTKRKRKSAKTCARRHLHGRNQHTTWTIDWGADEVPFGVAIEHSHRNFCHSFHCARDHCRGAA